MTLFFFFTYFFSVAQNTEETTLLLALKTLETTFNVRFSYAVEDISGVKVTLKSPQTLEASIEQLQKQTPFQFSKINERYITVVKSNEDLFCGRLLNAYTGVPLENASIVAQTGSFSTVTNSEGIFYVPKSISTEKLRLNFIGYETIIISVSELKQQCETILMQLEILELETVFIENYLVQGIEKKPDGSIRIKIEKFGLLPGQIENDILMIIQALPGIQSVNETISNINIRGGTHDENLTLWDDIKMYQNGHFFGLISAFNPDITKEVTIYKNGTPTRYGGGISGVIAMYSDDKIVNIFSGGAGFNLINGSAFGVIPLSKNATIQVSGRSSINTIWETPVYTSYSEKVFQDTEITNIDETQSGLNVVTEEDFNFYDFSTKILWNISESDKLRFNFLTMNNTLLFNETISETKRSLTSNLDQESIAGGISWRRNWSSAFSTSILGYGTYYHLSALNRDILTTQNIFQKNEVLETGIKLDATLRFSKQVQLESGYQFSETGISNEQDVNLPRFRDFKKEVLLTHSGFTGIDYTTVSKNTNINLGVRLNYFTKFDKVLVEPRFSLHQKLGGGFAFEAFGEFKSQTTTQRIDFESDFLGIEKRRWVLANNNEIPIIESKQVSIGFVYAKSTWYINVEGFYKDVNGITASNQGFQNQFQYEQSIGSYIASGVEIVINKKEKDFNAWFSYSYLENEYTFELFTPSVFPHNLDITHTATIAGSYTIKRLKFAFGLNWRSGKPYTVPLRENEILGGIFNESIQYDIPNSLRLPDYLRADISTEYLWKLSSRVNAKINLAVLNVFDTNNTLNIRYAIINDASGQALLNQVKASSIGLTPNFSFQVLF